MEKIFLLLATFKLIRDPRDNAGFKAMADKTADPAIYSAILSHLNATELGQKTLETQPTPARLSKEELSQLPEGSLGHEYFLFLERHNLELPEAVQVSSNPMTYIRSRLNAYENVWRVLLGYDVSLEEDIALQAFIAAQTNSALNVAQMTLSLVHGLIFKRESLSSMIDHLVHGWIRGKRCSAIFGVAFEEFYQLPMAQVREMFFNEKAVVKINRHQARDFRVS